MVDPTRPRPLTRFGVWIPGKGWLRGKGGPVADLNPAVARSAARLYGHGAFVTAIDESLIDCETQFLEQEKAPVQNKRFTWWRK